MRQTRASGARSLRWMSGLGVIAVLMAGCVVEPPPEPEPPADYDFNSAALGKVSLTIEGLAEEPVEVNADLPGRSIGSWDAETGDMTTQLTFARGTLPVPVPDLPVGVGYFLNQDADATGNFDPDTGQGSLDVDLTMTVASIDLGGGPVAMGQPCRVGMSLHLAGGVDLATKVLTVSQDGFTVTPPAIEHCDGLGELIGVLLGGPVNSMELSFSVAPAVAPPPVVDFAGPSTGELSFEVEINPEVGPVDVATPLVGTVAGSWDTLTGELDATLDFADGTIGHTDGVDHLWMDYSLAQVADASGSFDPTTGQGSLAVDLVLSIRTFDLGTELDILPPCDVGITLQLVGAVDLATDVLDVAQSSFTTTAPAAEACDGSGGVIGDLFGFPTNSASLQFSVAAA